MPVSADGLASLMGLGLAGETLLAVVRVIDAEQARTCGFVATVAADAAAAPARSLGAIRQERYRLRKLEKEGVTGADGECVTRSDAEIVTNTQSVTDEALLSPSSVMPVGDLFSPSSPSLPVLPSPPKRYNQTPSSNLPIPSTPPTLSAPATRRLRESEAGRIFDEQFWPAYPDREASNPKPKAREKFIRIVASGVDPQLLVESVKSYALFCRDDEPRFTMQTTRWLNEKNWLQNWQAKAENRQRRGPGRSQPRDRPLTGAMAIFADAKNDELNQGNGDYEYGSDHLIEYRGDGR